MTGANGALGMALIRASLGAPLHALVRSERAASVLRALPGAVRPEVHVVDYTDEQALSRVAAGSAFFVHLVGILRETRQARYEDAHEKPARVLARVAERCGVRRMVSLSILGADPASKNACLASRGRADEILLNSAVPTTVLRLPMVLGPGESAVRALAAQAAAPLVLLRSGGSSLEQPIDVRDVGAAVRGALADTTDASAALDLAGPQVITYRKLLECVAAAAGNTPRILPVPGALVRGFAALCETWLDNPPLTRPMLGVLEQDDSIDPLPAARRLGIQLTAPAETLRFCFAEDAH